MATQAKGRSRLIRVVAILAVVSTAVIAAGCGTTDSNQQASASPSTVTVTQPAPAAPAADTSSAGATDTGSAGSSGSTDSSSSDGGGSVSVPDEVGQRLDVAEDDLSGKGLTYDEIGGGTFGIVVRSNWTVCKTKPSGGSTASEGDSVKLIVARSC
jgi:hypothetical protein